VWLLEDGSCQNGHDASQISNVYETEVAKDPLAQAADSVEQAAREAGTAIKSAWDDVSPQAKEAADAAADAARKAAETAKGFGKKLFGHDEGPKDAGADAAESQPGPGETTGQ
jgi:hypothetical protein